MLRKYQEELGWWVNTTATQYIPWYRGEIPFALGCPLPADKVTRYETEWENACATLAQAQSRDYSDTLCIPLDYDCGALLDIGCGPFVSAQFLKHRHLFCLDALIEFYLTARYPIRQAGAVLLPLYAEDMWTIPDNFFDTIVSCNALDHVDDFEATAVEIQRVAKPDALLRLAILFRPEATKTEPLVIDDERVQRAFTKMPLRKLWEGYEEAAKIRHTLWGNREEPRN
jgi:SAM-dependent methyltransferase